MQWAYNRDVSADQRAFTSGEQVEAMRFGIRQRIGIIVLAGFVPLTLVIAFNLLHFFNELQQDAVIDHLRDARITAFALERFAHELAQVGRDAALAVTEAQLPAGTKQKFLSSLAGHTPADFIAVADVSGRLLASSTTSELPPAFKSTAAFKAVAAGAGYSVGPTYSLPDGSLALPVYSGTVTTHGERVVSVVIAHAKDLGAVLPVRETHGSAFVLDSAGNVLYADNPAVFPRASPQQLRRTPLVMAPSQGRTFSGPYIRLPGVRGEYLGTQAPAPGTIWSVGIFESSGQALAHVEADARGSLTLAGLVILVDLFLVVAVVSLGVIRPVERLKTATDRVGAGHFDEPIPSGGGSEIGDLARHFGQMRDSLKRTFGRLEEMDLAARAISESLDEKEVTAEGLKSVSAVLQADAVTLTQPTVAGGPSSVTSRLGEFADVDLLTRSSSKVETEAIPVAGYVLTPLPDGDRAPLYLLTMALPTREVPPGRVDALLSHVGVSEEELESGVAPVAVSLVQQLSSSLDNARLFSQQRDLAEAIQASLLTEPFPVPGLELAFIYRPSSAAIGARVGGDFYDFIRLEGGKFGVVIGDISGRGIDAARYTLIGKGAIRSFLLDDPDPSSALQRASSVIREAIEVERFITAAVVVIDPATGRMITATGGHPLPLLFHSRGGSVEVLPLGGPILGVFEGAIYPSVERVLSKGDKLLLYTDGLTDVRREGELFGERRVIEALAANGEKTARDVVEGIESEVLAFAEHGLSDDLAMVCIEKR